MFVIILSTKKAASDSDERLQSTHHDDEKDPNDDDNSLHNKRRCIGEESLSSSDADHATNYNSCNEEAQTTTPTTPFSNCSDDHEQQTGGVNDISYDHDKNDGDVSRYSHDDDDHVQDAQLKNFGPFLGGEDITQDNAEDLL